MANGIAFLDANKLEYNNKGVFMMTFNNLNNDELMSIDGGKTIIPPMPIGPIIIGRIIAQLIARRGKR